MYIKDYVYWNYKDKVIIFIDLLFKERNVVK